ncbi:hypothetical protein SAMN05660297_00565 [Natronincola peptidivorans]|uniref:N-formylglutamate amidohydrolase n=1 Tax=Natronincola peptidivorans TaxID=426128 RepID=A0A1H9ZI79_9FIRM|nr:hypothetical protein [Natronincola peptidivorans]SES81352.1 hypothetical protein SAMN05660297_00565 [Natronincola peptidivorans]
MEALDLKKMEECFIKEIDDNPRGHQIVKGKNPIILTAPHSVSHLREEKEKIGEFRTGVIVQLIGELSGCHRAYKTKNLGDDANYDRDCNFKSDLLEYIKENDIKLVLDFHLSSPNRAFSIDIGTGRRSLIQGREDLLSCIKGGFEAVYQNVEVDDTFPGSYPHTVSATASRELGIPAFQIEINWSKVDDYEKTKIFVNTMAKMINKLEELL